MLHVTVQQIIREQRASPIRYDKGKQNDKAHQVMFQALQDAWTRFKSATVTWTHLDLKWESVFNHQVAFRYNNSENIVCKGKLFSLGFMEIIFNCPLKK